MLDEVADGPAIRRRSARYTKEVVFLRGARVGRADDGPCCPVPMLDERLADVAGDEILANSPAIRRRSARHPKEVVGVRGVRRADDRPRWPSRSERHARRRSRGIALQWDSMVIDKNRSASRAGRGGFHPARWIRGEAEHRQQNADRAKSKNG